MDYTKYVHGDELASTFIAFRGLPKGSENPEKWVFGGYAMDYEGNSYIIPRAYADENNPNFAAVRIERDTLQRCTFMESDNLQDIYEGDMLAVEGDAATLEGISENDEDFESYKNVTRAVTGIVEFTKGAFVLHTAGERIPLYSLKKDTVTVTVIGNVATNKKAALLCHANRVLDEIDPYDLPENARKLYDILSMTREFLRDEGIAESHTEYDSKD